jgi:hypothetical protein
MLTGFFGIHELFGAHELFGVHRAFRSPSEHLRVFAGSSPLELRLY